MAKKILVNIGSGNGLLPDGTTPLPEPMLTDHQWSPMTLILGQIHKRCLNHESLKSVWKLHVLKFNSNLPGANELIFVTVHNYNVNIHDGVPLITVQLTDPWTWQAVTWINVDPRFMTPYGTLRGQWADPLSSIINTATLCLLHQNRIFKNLISPADLIV